MAGRRRLRVGAGSRPGSIGDLVARRPLAARPRTTVVRPRLRRHRRCGTVRAVTHSLILGAGFGGLACARALRRRLPAEHRITVVDRERDFVVGATQTWVMLGERDPREIARPRAGLLPAGVNLV